MKKLGMVLVLISLIFLFSGVQEFYVGVKNVDLVYNFQAINLKYHTNFTGDTLVDGTAMDFPELYREGVSLEINGMIKLFLSGLFLTSAVFFFVRNFQFELNQIGGKKWKEKMTSRRKK